MASKERTAGLPYEVLSVVLHRMLPEVAPTTSLPASNYVVESGSSLAVAQNAASIKEHSVSIDVPSINDAQLVLGTSLHAAAPDRMSQIASHAEAAAAISVRAAAATTAAREAAETSAAAAAALTSAARSTASAMTAASEVAACFSLELPCWEVIKARRASLASNLSNRTDMSDESTFAAEQHLMSVHAAREELLAKPWTEMDVLEMLKCTVVTMEADLTSTVNEVGSVGDVAHICVQGVYKCSMRIDTVNRPIFKLK